MTCWSARICTRWRGSAAVALVMLASSAIASAQAQTPAPAPMNMADHRGALQGRVRSAQGAPVPDAAVTAISEENGAQFVATTNAQAYELYFKATDIFNRRDGAHFGRGQRSRRHAGHRGGAVHPLRDIQGSRDGARPRDLALHGGRPWRPNLARAVAPRRGIPLHGAVRMSAPGLRARGFARKRAARRTLQ